MKTLLFLFASAVVLILPLRLARAEAPIPYPLGTAFPLELYEVEPSSVPELAKYGWNIFQSYHPKNPEQIDQYLSVLNSNNVGGFAVIPCSQKKLDKTEWPQNDVVALVQNVSRNSNLAWWDLPEEARPWAKRETKLLQDYTAWTRLADPDRRPTYEYTPNNRNAEQLSHIVPTVDILGLSCYCEEMRMPHAWVRYKVQEAGLHAISLAGATAGSDYLHGQKTPVAIIYCARFKTGGMPAPDQTYHDFWSAIASGAQGIGVYAYYHATHDDPALAQNFARLNQAASEISGPEKIGAAVLRGKPAPNVTFKILAGPEWTVSFRPPTETKSFRYSSLNLLSKTLGGALYIIAVNSTSENVTAEIAGLPAGVSSVPVSFEKRSVAVQDERFTDAFGPWRVHIYKCPLP